MTCDTNASRRDSAPRRRKTRRHELVGKPAEIGETRDEAEKIDDVGRRDMQVDRLLNRQAVYLANLPEVRAIFSAIADRDFPIARLGQTFVIHAVEVWTKTGLEFLMA